MDIQEQLELTLRHCFLETRTNQLDLGQSKLQTFLVVISEEKTIHVFSLSVASVIASDDAIWIDNGRNPKVILISHLVANDLFGDQKVYESVQNKRRMSLTTMLSANEHNDWLWVVVVLFSIADLDERDIDVTIRVTHRLKPYELVSYTHADRHIQISDPNHMHYFTYDTRHLRASSA